ncbi:MAG: ferrous iron transport protein A [Crenarchaeota archaeon]|nr:ferrous iron transport protein A [Thermoproteota archaeon]
MSLCTLPAGSEVKIQKISCTDNIIKRLNELGFTQGTVLKIIRGEDDTGPVLVEVRDSRIMLGNDVASKIIVNQGE